MYNHRYYVHSKKKSVGRNFLFSPKWLRLHKNIKDPKYTTSKNCTYIHQTLKKHTKTNTHTQKKQKNGDTKSFPLVRIILFC